MYKMVDSQQNYYLRMKLFTFISLHCSITLKPILYVIVFTLIGATVAKRLRTHALDHFPGPRLARWTWLYRAYYDVVIGGGWLSHLERLHQTYGPVVRVGHNELHFSSPTAYADIYGHSPLHPKDPRLYGAFTWASPSSFSETDPKEHAITKSMLSSFFSRKNVLGLEDVVQECVDRLLHQLSKNHHTTPANMDLAFRSLTLDIITLYTFGISVDAVSAPSFEHPVLTDLRKHSGSKWFYRHFPLLKRLVIKFPTWFATLTRKESSLALLQEIMRLVDSALQDPNRYDAEYSANNIYHSLLANEGRVRGSNRLTKEWLVGEGQNLRGAGSDTVANTCMVGCRYILSDVRVLRSLQEELTAAWPNKDERMPLRSLEKLPYLTAIIKECLRMSHGVVTPMSRVVPASGSIIAGYPVPPGTAVAMGNTFMHMNPDIFSRPKCFYPERWMHDHRALEKYLVAFGKGPRSCLGINLAWCELYLILGNLFRKLDLSPSHDISESLTILDYFIPLFKEEMLKVTINARD